MAVPIGGIHHLTLTVTDTARSKAFYMKILGFAHLTDLGDRVLLNRDALVLALCPPADPAQAIPDDRFNECRVGLDHVSFGVTSHADMEAAVKLFDENNVPHGTINDLSGAGVPIYVLAFRDPDNIQLELTAPHS